MHEQSTETRDVRTILDSVEAVRVLLEWSASSSAPMPIGIIDPSLISDRRHCVVYLRQGEQQVVRVRVPAQLLIETQRTIKLRASIIAPADGFLVTPAGLPKGEFVIKGTLTKFDFIIARGTFGCEVMDSEMSPAEVIEVTE